MQDQATLTNSPAQYVKHSNAAQLFWRDSKLPFVESRRSSNSRACYLPHHHPTYSIGCVDHGSSIFTGAPNGPITLHPGTLVFVPAERTHACNPAPGKDWSYQMLHINTQWLEAVRKEYVDRESKPLDSVQINTSLAAYARFCRLNALLFSAAEPQDKEAALIEFIGESDSANGLRLEAPEVSHHHAARIHPLLSDLRTTPAATASLNELALRTGLSRYQLIRTFRAVTGLTPHAWQLNERINFARRRLLCGDELADLAHNLGFADQAHFQRVFKAYTGVTPGSFRA